MDYVESDDGIEGHCTTRLQRSAQHELQESWPEDLTSIDQVISENALLGHDLCQHVLSAACAEVRGGIILLCWLTQTDYV